MSGKLPIGFLRVFALPIPADGRRRLVEPGAILPAFQDVHCREVFHGVGLGRAERLQQSGGHENRDVVRLEVENQAGLLNVEPRGQFAKQTEKSVLLLIHVCWRVIGVQQ
jgi:hypothetical protein